MQGDKKKIIEYLKKQNDEEIFFIDKIKNKPGRTRQQEKTYWRIFKGIGDKIGYTKEQVKFNMLTALFGTYELKMFGEIHLVPHKTSTTQLNKEEAIYLIDGILEYAKKIDAGIEITPREITSLYESYN